MDFQKKNWQFNDIITEGELNRMEDGIEEGIAKAEDAKTNIETHVNDKNNPHNVTPEQIGAETPQGAQAKANQAEENAKNYSDQQVSAHASRTDNPHNVTKQQVGLGNVDNVQQIPMSQKGQPNGVATLDDTGKVPSSQLPEIDAPVKSVNGKTGDVQLTASDVGAPTVQQHDQLEQKVDAHVADIATSTQLGHVKVGQNLVIDSDGTLHAAASGGKKVARFVIGTSTAGWTENDVDYLCDGISDHVEINQAIQAIPDSGGEIVILDGTYNITAPINVNKSNVSIKGNGNATVLKRMWDSSSTEGVITLNSVSNCKIENLQIDGNESVYTSTYNYGIRLSSSNNNTITGNTCNNNYHGIHLSSSSNNTITGNTCNNNDYYSIALFNSSNNIVTGNTCNNNNFGIYLYFSSNNTVTGNTCNNNDYYGIYPSSSSNNNTVTGNTCNNNREGISLSSNSNNTITGNTCNNNDTGIYLSSSSNNTITGNTCIRGTGQSSDYTSSQYTIRLAGSGNSYNLISSNNCMGKDVVIEGGTGNTSVNNKYN